MQRKWAGELCWMSAALKVWLLLPVGVILAVIAHFLLSTDLSLRSVSLSALSLSHIRWAQILHVARCSTYVFEPLLANMELIWSEWDGVGSGYFNRVHQQYVLQPEQKSINLWWMAYLADPAVCYFPRKWILIKFISQNSHYFFFNNPLGFSELKWKVVFLPWKVH